MFSTRVAGAAISAALFFPAVAHAQLPPEVEACLLYTSDAADE